LFKKAISSLILLGVCAAPLAVVAQDRDDHHEDHQQQQYVRHEEWKRGYHMKDDDWNRGEHVEDYRAHHLTEPRKGYEWRHIDGNYVMADRNGVVSTVVIEKQPR